MFYSYRQLQLCTSRRSQSAHIATSMQYQLIKHAVYIRDVKPNLIFFCVIPSLLGTHALLGVNKGVDVNGSGHCVCYTSGTVSVLAIF